MIIETRDNMVVRLRPRPNLDVNRYFMCDHGRAELPLDEPRRPRRGAAGPCTARRCTAPTGTLAHRAKPRRCCAARRRSCSRRRRCRTRRCSCSSSSADKTGGAGAYPRRRRARKRRSRASRTWRSAPSARQTRSGAELLGFTRSDKPLAALGAGDVLDRRRRRAGWRRCCRMSPRPDAIIVIGTTLPAWARHAAAVVLPIANIAEEEGTFTNRAAACSATCRPRRRREWRGRAGMRCPICSTRSAPAPATRSPVKSSARSQRPPGVRRHDLRHARAQGSHDRRRDGGSGIMTLFALLRPRGRGRRRARAPAAAGQRLRLVPRHDREDARRRSRSTWSASRCSRWLERRSARGSRTARPEPRRPARAAAARRRRRQEHHEGRDVPGRRRTLPLFLLAPALSFIPALLTWAVIPFGAPLRTRNVGHASTWSLAPTCRSASSSSSRSPRSASTASCSPAGRRTTSTRCSAGCARARR